MTTTDSRQRFEKWATLEKPHLSLLYREGKYNYSDTRLAWEAWQAALSAQTTNSRVTDAMVEAAADKHMQVRGLGMLRPWLNCTEETRASYRLSMRAALEAALTAQAPSVAVGELEELLSDASNAIDYMMDTDVIEASKLRNLIKANGHE